MSRNNIIALVAAAIMLVVMCVGFSAATPLVRSTPADHHEEQERVSDFAISESKDLASWTAFGREWRVRLELSNVVEDNTDYYYGTLEGDESAAVSFVLLPGLDFSGMISSGDSTWWVRAMPVAESNYSEDENDLAFFMVKETNSVQSAIAPFAAPLHADVEEEEIEAELSEESEGAPRKRAVTAYKVAVYVDQRWAAASNPWASQANTIGIFNDINAVYKAAGLAQFQVVYGKQISTSLSSLTPLLNYFSGTAANSITAFTDRSYTNYMWLIGANIGGLAYVGSSCRGTGSSQKQKTGVAGLASFSRLWTVKTIAHELGHNRGAVHEFTNACSGSTKTNCQCSLMSYCFPTASNNPRGAVNYFSTTSIAKMKATGCY